MAQLLKLEDRPVLIEALTQAILTIDTLKTWLGAHYPNALPQLGPGHLGAELPSLITWADGEDGMRTLLQRLADHPPGEGIPPMIFAFTHGEIKQQAKTNRGLPPVPADQSWFAASRPFVNRSPLRKHLRELDSSDGVESVLVIDGEARTGKSFAVSLAMGFEPARRSRPRLDIEDYARSARGLNARDLAVEIAGVDKGCPPFDDTKESEAVPRLLIWLTARLNEELRERQTLWIIIDHCNRPALTDGARSILAGLAERLCRGDLPGVRLILVDFDRNELPPKWRDFVRHDRAELPGKEHVAEWFLQLATAAKRKYAPGAPVQWAGEVFAGVNGCCPKDGSWFIELERQLRQGVDRILACEELA
jgi:hypothetical protein